MNRYLNFLILRKGGALMVLSLFLFVTACNNTTDGPVKPQNQYLVDSSPIVTLSKADIAKNLVGFDPLISNLLANGVKAYRLTYKTKNTDGKEITASGALILPETDKEVAMVSVQHGTITSDEQAPSNFKDNSEANTVGATLGALGYIISYPDYIGYGASKDLPHPYEHRASLASASLDMLRAAKEFLKQQSAVKWNNKLYIAGYSEGGFASMSLQKKIEEEAPTEFNLRASSLGAGAYDKTSFMKYLINNKTQGDAGFNRSYLWVTLTYDRIYGLNRPKSAYFKEPWASRIDKDGLGTNIDVSFNTIFTDSFIKGVNDGSDTGFLNAVADNNVYDWKPATPTQLYHGTDDNLVFFFNSQNAYDAMKKRGAPNVSLIPLKGDHGSSLPAYLQGTLIFFISNP